MKRCFSKIIAVLTAAVLFITVAVIPVSAAGSKNVPDTEAMRFVDAMGAGWNLGNAFDASDCTWLTNKLDYETAWSKAKTTKDLIKTVKRS